MSTRFSSLSALLAPSPDHLLVGRIFLRVLALIYLAAFLSAAVQITGLVGEQGILPIGELMQAARQHLGPWAMVRLPMVFWLDHGDTTLLLVCYSGALFALLLLFGRLQTPALVILFLLYLSVFHAGQIFFNFQWDYLLLEAGFLAIFLGRGASPLLVFMFHWLLFRLRFLSGLSKLSSDDPSWAGLTALQHYFETQPLPHMGAWYAHQLPEWMLRAGTGFTLFVELIVPFFIFLPRPFRLFAAAATILVQAGIIATSNHNFINLLTIALCLFLLDDRVFRRNGFTPPPARPPRPGIARGLQVPAFALLLATSVATAARIFVPGAGDGAWYTPFERVRAWGIGNAYHVFPTMQTERQELIIEGSMDGRVWSRALFRHKPDGPDEIPGFIVPHQPRLDWMIWFVPTRNPAMRPWFERFMWRLQQDSGPVRELLERTPFPGQAPRYLRVRVERYRFGNARERARDGTIWQVVPLGPFGQVPPRSP